MKLWALIPVVGSVLWLNSAVVAELSEGEVTADQARQLCGVNCLYLICHYYDIDVSYEEIEFMLDPSDNGTSMLRIGDVANALGLETIAARIPASDLKLFTKPLIAWYLIGDVNTEDIQPGHFVLIMPVPGDSGFWAIDPPRKAQWVSHDELIDSQEALVPVMLFRPSVLPEKTMGE